MEFKQQKSWVKHLDFILLDLACLQAGFLFAFWIKHGFDANPYTISIYRNEVLMLILIQLMVAIIGKNFKDVLRRGFYREFMATFKQAMLVTLFSVFYLFILKESSFYSRTTMLLTGALYLCMSYLVRLGWKLLVKVHFQRKEGHKSLVIITTSDRAKEAIETIQSRNYHDYVLTGLVLLDQNAAGTQLYDMDVVANASNVVSYVCRSWVDELYIDVDRNYFLPQKMLDAFNEMGLTVHLKLQGMENPYHRVQYVEKMVGVTVMTFAVNDLSPVGMFAKRIIDILGGLVGCIFTILLTIIIAPIIYIKSPGPIFFSQKRVGKNGKYFKMYKFRSMYPDAEERKKELMKQNEHADGMMFKMKDDPRIIKGIGHFIRKTSIDEFPQFFNVLKGDMSLVGTRPPTIDEWEKYKAHHRVRMSMRPGITGMWQVSGRSDITEFEEVVKLDAEYISKWNVGLDIKIMLMTVAQVLKGSGAR
ncbi:MAG: sugar transferase [Lachnospiraceae bacterium]|nr:sugar transferase [Lachnospiraceae bacterium]